MATYKRRHGGGVRVARHPDVVGNRLLRDFRAVARVLPRGGVGVGLVRRDALDGRAGEELRAGGVRGRRFKIDCVPALRKRHRLADMRGARRRGGKRRRNRKDSLHCYFASNLKNWLFAPSTGTTYIVAIPTSSSSADGMTCSRAASSSVFLTFCTAHSGFTSESVVATP